LPPDAYIAFSIGLHDFAFTAIALPHEIIAAARGLTFMTLIVIAELLIIFVL
jgi:hypothetical protein